MERERFLTGYCRKLDQSRIVTVVDEDGELTEIDCAYTNCPHAPNCPIARQIEE